MWLRHLIVTARFEAFLIIVPSISLSLLGGAIAGGASAPVPNIQPATLPNGQMPAVSSTIGSGQASRAAVGNLSVKQTGADDFNANKDSKATPKGGLTRRPGKSATAGKGETLIGHGGAPPVSYDDASEDSRLDPKKTDGISKNMPSSSGVADQQAKFIGAGAGAAGKLDDLEGQMGVPDMEGHMGGLNIEGQMEGLDMPSQVPNQAALGGVGADASGKLDDLEGQMRENGAKLNEAEVQARAELEAKQKEMERQKMEMMNQMEGDWANKAPPGLLEKIMGYINFVEAKKKRLEKARAEAEA